MTTKREVAVRVYISKDGAKNLRLGKLAVVSEEKLGADDESFWIEKFEHCFSCDQEFILTEANEREEGFFCDECLGID